MLLSVGDHESDVWSSRWSRAGNVGAQHAALLHRPRPNAVTGEEFLARLAHVVPASDHALRRGQSLEDERAIPLRDDAPIQEDYGADVRFAADQPAEALFQLERRVRYEIMAEAVQPLRFEALEPRGGEGLARHLEGQLREDEHPQRSARHVHPLPK